MKTNTLQIRFKAKPETVPIGDIERKRILLPEIGRRHCVDMNAWRNSRRFGAYANSDLFPAVLEREVARIADGATWRGENRRQYVWIDNPLRPEVSVDASGFLAVLTITVPDCVS